MMVASTIQTNITGRSISLFNCIYFKFIILYLRICLLTSSQACQVEFSTDGPFMLEKWGNFKTNPYTRAGVTSQYCVKVCKKLYNYIFLKLIFFKDYLQIPGGSNKEGTLTHDRYLVRKGWIIINNTMLDFVEVS